ncbi:hypothetical protein [Streptomyces kanamyceticus]|uniref:phosphotransferase-like protein n=1 Tax=Streptomyces kanamyceticus TaxID=1967 RepID=UPI0037DD5777
MPCAWIRACALITAAPSVRTAVDRNPYNRHLAQRNVRVICKCWWVGVRCDAAVAAGREVARGDQTIGSSGLPCVAAFTVKAAEPVIMWRSRSKAGAVT